MTSYTKSAILGMNFRFSGTLHMTSSCKDGKCYRMKQDIDDAIRHERNIWSVMLKSSQDLDDVNHALRFCEVFRLEAKVEVDSNGLEVLVRDDFIRLL
ncbi:MAG: hypothetical protein ACXADC_15295 [Candidatus Thorarchaeota archaeon]